MKEGRDPPCRGGRWRWRRLGNQRNGSRRHVRRDIIMSSMAKNVKVAGPLLWWTTTGSLLRENLEARAAGAAEKWRSTRARLETAARDWGRIVGGSQGSTAGRMMGEYLSALVDLSRFALHPSVTESVLLTTVRYAREFASESARAVESVAEGFPSGTFKKLMEAHTGLFIDGLSSWVDGDRNGFEKADSARMMEAERLGMISAEWMLGSSS